MAQIKTQYEEDLASVEIPNLTNLYGSSILVTGATGLIGKCIVKVLNLLNQNTSYIVYAGCRDIDRAKTQIGIEESEYFRYVTVDVTRPIVQNVCFDYIIDAASSASPNKFKNDPVGVMKANLFGVCNLMEYGANHGIKRFLYVSSGEVYGQGTGEFWKEDQSGFIDPVNLRSAYPSSKRCAETLCIAYSCQFGIDVVIARLCHTYGPEFQQSDNRAYAQFFTNVCEREAITLKSKGGQNRSWLYVVDCVSAILNILVNGQNRSAYNVADPNALTTVSGFAEIVGRCSGLKVQYVLETDENQTPIKTALFNIDKITLIGWCPKYNLEEGISHSILHLKTR